MPDEPSVPPPPGSSPSPSPGPGPGGQGRWAAGQWGPGPPGPPAGYGPPGSWYAQPRTEGLAIGAFVCALVSYAFCLVPAIVALVLAQNAAEKIDVSGGWLTGRGFVTAARILAWINVGLVVLALIALLVGLAASSSSSSLGPIGHLAR